jgi:hypothetical protein
MPFVQGHLRNEAVEVTIQSECAHCAQPIRLEVDRELRYRVLEGGDPLVFLPLLDFEKLKAPSIIDDF